MQTDAAIAKVTLQQLQKNPQTPIPHGPGYEVLGDEAHVRRLLQWAAIGAMHEQTTVKITAHLCFSHYSPLLGALDLKLPRPAMHRDDFQIFGWSLQLTTPGHDPRMIDMGFDGYIVNLGSQVQQDAEWKKYATIRQEEARRQRAKDGLGLRDAVQHATQKREYAQKALEEAEQNWRAAVKAAILGKESATEIARLANVSRERVYQIRDDRR